MRVCTLGKGRAMKAKVIGAMVVVLLAAWAAPALAQAPTPWDPVSQVSQSQYQTYQLAVQNMGLGLYGGPAYNQGYRNRYNSGGPAAESLGFKEATLYLSDQFAAMGLSVTVQGDYKNVVAELPGAGTTDKVFIISGHYDHPQYDDDRPGGDDNASGTAGVLEAARVLSQYQFDATIRFIGWGGEEGWMLGSWDYVRNVVKANNQNVVGMLNLDMIIRPGWDGDPGAVIDLDIGTRMERPNCAAWADSFRAAAGTYAPSLPIDPVTHGADIYNEWYAGDQGPFMSDGYDYPGLMVAENTATEIWSGEANYYYHKYGDASDRAAGALYDYGFATDVVRASVGMIATEADLLLPGDTDNDGDVDNADIGMASGSFTGAGVSTAMTWADGDVDGDGDVDNADIGFIAGAFTGSASGGAPIPEPATLSLLGLGGLAVMRRRRAV